jgi:tetratricopeptide (TPR) repeat protein
MKKLIILLIATFIVAGLNAQNAKRTSAFNYFKNGKLDKAKEYIDPTIEDEKTMNVAKTWYYRGNIYLGIALSDNPEYRALDPNALEVAYESYKRCAELDDRGEFTTDIQHNFRVIASNFFNQGVAKYNEGDYTAAARSFLNTYNISKEIGVTDTLALTNAALAYDIAGATDLALEHYLKLMEMGYEDPLIYNSLAALYLNQMNDTVLSEKYVLEGREIFPDDYQLLIAETNLNLARGENEKALKNLQIAMEKDPLNKTIWFALGTNYENVGNIAEAEKAYLKCIEIDPLYADAYYNMGAMFNNQAAEIIDKANELPLDAVKEYDAAKAKADSLLEKALPFLEKSNELNPDNMATMQTLKQIYTILNMMDKLKAINERIHAITDEK